MTEKAIDFINAKGKTMRVLNNKILLTKIEEENKTKSGIILTTENKDRITKFKVVQIAPNEEGITENSIVYVDRFQTTEITIEGDKMAICDIKDVVIVE
jgi:co-chaperonin GroES (HSP10)